MIESAHALYRFFNPDGVLLYVGITNNPARRFAQHGAGKDWWHEVATIRMEKHGTREAVLAAEREAIIAERPRYNVVHANGSPQPFAETAPTAPGGYPVTAGEVVALALAPDHQGEVSCPVGMISEVSPLGVKVWLMSWLSGAFGKERFVAWGRIMEIRWAYPMDPYAAREQGYRFKDDEVIWDCDDLGFFQTHWCHGKAQAIADRQAALARRR